MYGPDLHAKRIYALGRSAVDETRPNASRVADTGNFCFGEGGYCSTWTAIRTTGACFTPRRTHHLRRPEPRRLARQPDHRALKRRALRRRLPGRRRTAAPSIANRQSLAYGHRNPPPTNDMGESMMVLLRRLALPA